MTKNKSSIASKVNNLDSFAASLTPKKIVQELDKHIIGQDDAKKSVAIALRNRFRRKMVDPSLREEIVPKNILMVGPTGVGKTEIARRLAKLANAPFIKVEATKFTEVGYVGRDVDSIIRDLVDVAIKSTKDEMKKEVESGAKEAAKKTILDILVGNESLAETREKFSKMFEKGELNDREIEVEVLDTPSAASTNFDIPGGQVGMINLSDVLGKAMNSEKTKKSKMKIADAFKVLSEEESNKMIDEDAAVQKAINSVENDGIVFIDEFDKICGKGTSKGSAEVSRDGVQRDLLPLVEGTAISTKYGVIKTDHILFIASGAFHVAKPSDLLPELQGRFPIRVQLKPLTEGDLVRILTEPEACLIKQYVALIGVEKVKLNFVEESIKEIAKIAFRVNGEIENIGARRLHTMLEKILEEVSFDASEMKDGKEIKIDAKYINDHLGDTLGSKIDLSKFIL